MSNPKNCTKNKDKHPIESAYFHFSHLKKKQDYGHQAAAVLLSCNGVTLLYSIEMYDKTVSKIGLVEQIVRKLPDAPNGGYLLCDSWYVCGDIIETFASKGFCTVGALKTNRVVYPACGKMNVADHARFLSDEQGKTLFDIVYGFLLNYSRKETALHIICKAVTIFRYSYFWLFAQVFFQVQMHPANHLGTVHLCTLPCAPPCLP